MPRAPLSARIIHNIEQYLIKRGMICTPQVSAVNAHDVRTCTPFAKFLSLNLSLSVGHDEGMMRMRILANLTPSPVHTHTAIGQLSDEVTCCLEFDSCSCCSQIYGSIIGTRPPIDGHSVSLASGPLRLVGSLLWVPY